MGLGSGCDGAGGSLLLTAGFLDAIARRRLWAPGEISPVFPHGQASGQTEEGDDQRCTDLALAAFLS